MGKQGALMAQMFESSSWNRGVPGWVPDDIRLYLDHIEGGLTIRALARDAGVHASTIHRKVRKTESRRDDPLVDKVLIHLGRLRRDQGKLQSQPDKVSPIMNDISLDEITLKRDATRILHALMQPGAVLAVVPDVETAVVVRESADGRPRQIATVSSRVAEAMALQNWITCRPQGRVARYYISAAGRAALNRFLAEEESKKAGFSEAPAQFSGSSVPAAGTGANLHAIPGGIQGERKTRRAIGAEPPLQVLARRRDKMGQNYLSADLVRIGERLRLDFELAQLEQPIGQNGGQNRGQNWAAMMQAKAVVDPRAGIKRQGNGLRQKEARDRLQNALRFLGPELGDIALMTCCHQLGMEHAEKQLIMPARSGKYVLRIALNMLARHYAEIGGNDHEMIF